MTCHDEDPTPVTSILVPDHQRLGVTADLFGIHYPLRLEPAIYSLTQQLTPDYSGGYWSFFTLSNGGFYQSPESDRDYDVVCFNAWRGLLSAEALGLVVCLTAYSHLSFGADLEFARLCGRHYHLLYPHIFGHPEVASILRAID